MARTFPEGFRWGVACSGHQTEGGNRRSDTRFLEHVRPTVFREPSGQACNGYQLWREDVDLVAALGLDTYRFSVEWARVEPTEGQFSAAANVVLPEEMDAMADGMTAGYPAQAERGRVRRDRAGQRGRRSLRACGGHRQAATQRNVFRMVTTRVCGSWNCARARCRTSRTACSPAACTARAPPAEHRRPRTASSIEA